MRPSYSPSTLPSSVSKLHYVSYFEQIINCGSSYTTCASEIIEHEQQDFNFNSNSKSSSSSSSSDQASYDADNEQQQQSNTNSQSLESAKEYFDRIKKQFPSINNQKVQSPTATAASTETETETTSKSPIVTRSPKSNNKNKNKNKQQPPHYDMFKVVIPERTLKHTDSDSTQSTQSMSSDDDMSFNNDNDDDDCDCDEESREGIEEEHKPISILRRKQKLDNIVVVTRNTRHGVRFSPLTKFPNPNDVQYKRKKVPRLTSKQKQELLLNNYTSEIILPHLSPQFLTVHTHNNNEFRDYSSNNNSMSSHTDTELRRLQLQRRLQRRSQQQQYQYQDEQLLQQQLSMASSSDTSDGFYVFR
jgi:hypothetical protein